MVSLKDTCFYTCLVAVLSGFSLVQSAHISDAMSKRSWSMLRLGRGLQMLRLGKRDGMESEQIQPLDRLSEEQLNALILALTEPRDQGRRQPPLPRYGREITSSARDLLDLLTSESSGEETPGETVVFRHPPRGGRRYKRSLESSFPSDLLSAFDTYSLGQAGPKVYRAVALPRYGRFTPRLQAKAVPRPRVGRSKEAESTDQDTSENSGN